MDEEEPDLIGMDLLIERHWDRVLWGRRPVDTEAAYKVMMRKLRRELIKPDWRKEKRDV